MSLLRQNHSSVDITLKYCLLLMVDDGSQNDDDFYKSLRLMRDEVSSYICCWIILF